MVYPDSLDKSLEVNGEIVNDMKGDAEGSQKRKWKVNYVQVKNKLHL